MMDLSQNEKKALILIIFFLLLGGGVRLYSAFSVRTNIIPLNQKSEPVSTLHPLEFPDYSRETPTPSEEKKEIVSHVCGAVKAAGLYTLPAGSRVKDFIDAAGGPSKDADLEAINLARHVQDGEKLFIPATGLSGTTPFVSPEVSFTEGPEPKAITPGVSPTRTDGRVNINTATLADLDSLPGIGPVMAERIIEYRKTKGAFNTPDDIKNVDGIGEKTFDKIKDYIVVE